MTPSDSAGPKITGRCKQGAIIFHRGRVVVNFVPKFVAMATGVGRGKILMTQSDSPFPKIGGRWPSYRAVARRGLGGAQHPYSDFSAPVLREALSTPMHAAPTQHPSWLRNYKQSSRFDQLIIWKIIKFVATRCHILKVKIHQIRFRLGLRPRPHW